MSNFVVTVDTQRLRDKLVGIQGKMRSNLLRIMKHLSIELQKNVMKDKLSGQVLHNKSGTLRRSINQEINTQGDVITATVGTNVKYAHIHEFGFQGTVKVKEHMRMMKQAWGKPVKEPHQIRVNAFLRNVNMPERSFLRSALKEMEPHIREEINKVAKESIK